MDHITEMSLFKKKMCLFSIAIIRKMRYSPLFVRKGTGLEHVEVDF